METGISNLIEGIKIQADNLAGELISLRRDFHMHPELSHQEEHTAAVIARYLRDLGLEVRTGIAGHGVVGSLSGSRPGKAVAWRADMDALPIAEKAGVPWRSLVDGVMHACGHDFHLAIALGAARLLSRLKDRLAGEFRFIFQPAEEVPKTGNNGAPGMVAAGALDNPRVAAVMALHVAPNVEAGHIRYHRQEVMAGADHLTLTVTGKSVHGATPHKGVDPILVSAQALNLIQGFLAQRIDARHPVVLTFGTISGGSRFNILADKVVLEGSLRFLREGVRREVVEGLTRKLAGLAQATGARIDLEVRSIYPVLKNDLRLTDQAVAALRQILGPERLKSHFPAMGSEDFSYFAAQVPAFYFFLGVKPPGGKSQALHSPHFNPDELALTWGLKAAAGLLASLTEAD
jgi:amidohydrolase